MFLKHSHVRLLIQIAETGKLQSAAEALAISQPAASRILSDLETQAGGALFRRHPKGMEPTPVGAVFLKRARVILSEFESLEAEIDDAKAGRAGKIRVGSVSGPTVGCLVPAIRHVKTISPKIEATIEVGTSAELFRGLQEGRFDFIIARPPPSYDTLGYRVMPARGEVVSLVVNPDHPLAHRQGLQLGDLADYEWVVQERGSPIRTAVEQAFHAQDLPTPANITNSSSLLVVLAMVKHSPAIASLAHEVAELVTQPANSDAPVILKLETPISVTPYFVMYDRNRQFSPSAELVLQEVIARL